MDWFLYDNGFRHERVKIYLLKYRVKSVQIQSFSWSVFSPNAGKYRPEKTPYLDTFHAVKVHQNKDFIKGT